MKCPVDENVLETQIYESDIEVDVCPSCNGMWLDKGELEKIEEVREHDYTEELKRMPDYVGRAYEMARQKGRAELCCPKCGDEMEKREYCYCSQIIIDVCIHGHGIWLDNGEIRALEIFFERSQGPACSIRKSFWVSLKKLLGK